MNHTLTHQCLHPLICCLLACYQCPREKLPCTTALVPTPVPTDMTPATLSLSAHHHFPSLLVRHPHTNTCCYFPRSSKTEHPSPDHTSLPTTAPLLSELLEDWCVFALWALIILFQLPSIQFPPPHNYSQTPSKLYPPHPIGSLGHSWPLPSCYSDPFGPWDSHLLHFPFTPFTALPALLRGFSPSLQPLPGVTVISPHPGEIPILPTPLL